MKLLNQHAHYIAGHEQGVALGVYTIVRDATDTYQLATMGRRRAVDLMVERSQSVERVDKDCEVLKDPNLSARIDGKPISNPSQRQVLVAFCGAGASKQR